MILYLLLLLLFFGIAPYFLDKVAKQTKLGQLLGGYSNMLFYRYSDRQ